MQSSIIKHAEEWARANDEYPLYSVDPEALGEHFALAESAVVLAEGSEAGAIVVVEAGNGDLTRAISACRPDVPVVAVTPSLKVARQLMVNRGVDPIHSSGDAVKEARDAGFAGSVVCLDGDGKLSVLA